MLTQDVEILAAGIVTSRSGDVTTDWTRPTVVATVKGFLQERLSEDDDLRRSREWARAKLFLANGSPVLSTSRVRVLGLVWEVIGPPVKNFAPRGQHHIQCWVERVEG